MTTLQVLVRKTNEGVTFTLIGKRGKSLRTNTDVRQRAVSLAEDRWREGALKAAAELGIADSGYITDLSKGRYRHLSNSCGHTLALEPWGFARKREDGTIGMNDTGSTPTDFRARVLLAWEAPLTEIEVEPRCYKFESVWDIEAPS